MLLTFQQINSITQGACWLDNTDGLVGFHRFSREEEEMYAPTQFRGRSLSTSGIQLIFNTDGDGLEIAFETARATSRTYFSVDIFVNDQLCKRIQNFDETTLPENYTTTIFPLGAFSEKADLGKGEKTVRIVLPWSVQLHLRTLVIENATYVTPAPKAKKIIMYGDSITHGYDTLYAADSYANRFAHALDAELYNKAIGGECFVPALSAIGNDFTPDYITVAYGTNDWSCREQDRFRQCCGEFFENLVKHYPTTPIFAITPIWRKDHEKQTPFGDFARVEEIIREVCKQYTNITVLRGFAFVPQDSAYFADLRLHPNYKGFAHYFQNLKAAFDACL